MRLHGVDRHKRYWTISQRDECCQQVRFVARQWDVAGYVEGLSSQDVVALEASSGAFVWADRIEAQGARCVVVDPYRFRIIRDSWNKTDRRDAVNLSLGLWMAHARGECRLPDVYKPSLTVRRLRLLFGQWQILNKQVRQLKNEIQGVLTEEGVSLEPRQARRLVDTPAGAPKILQALELSTESRFCIQMSLKLLESLLEQKELLRVQILQTGRPLQSQVNLLIGIRGITPLLALAFLTDVGDILRFPSLRRMYAYLGVVPRIHASGGVTRVGHLNRSSRSLTRSLFTQAIPHLVDSSPLLGKWYEGLAERKGKGRARIGVLRKVFGIMRRMLLNGSEYRFLEPVLFQKKLREYQRMLEGTEIHQDVA